ncbi:MAG: FAD-dependent monooxygenase [Lentisphaeria bacterium]|nr:FAD-dependent monooxygenase [Lentisphaeria bacterium]
MAESYDTAVIGAGPAGAVAARLLSARYRVVLVDRR